MMRFLKAGNATINLAHIAMVRGSSVSGELRVWFVGETDGIALVLDGAQATALRDYLNSIAIDLLPEN